MLILLDIDGVMVPAKPWNSPPILEDGFYAFSAKAVAALSEIIEKSGASILLTTSHKYSFTLEKWVSVLQNRGIDVSGIDRLEKNVDYLTRLQEIEKWFAASDKKEDFVIIDDEKQLNKLPPILKERLIQTQPLIGLNDSHVEEALNILQTPLQVK